MSCIPPLDKANALTQPFSKAMDAFQMRRFVCDQIGTSNLASFELWAFNYDAGIIYNDTIVFLWNNAHSSCTMQSPHTDALKKIIDIWKKRFDQEVTK